MPTQKDFTNPHFSTKPKFFIIGAGRVGATLTLQLVRKGFSVISVVVEKDRRRIYHAGSYKKYFPADQYASYPC